MKLGFKKEDSYSCCALCDNRILFKNADNTLNLDNYKEVSFLTSIASIMTVGFCPACVEKARTDNALFKSIMDSVKEGWKLEQEHENWPEEEKQRYEKNFGSLDIVNWYHGNNDVGK